MTVASPCIRQCCLDSRDICLGCGRHITEITGWASASEFAKQEICTRAKQRQLQRKILHRELTRPPL